MRNQDCHTPDFKTRLVTHNTTRKKNNQKRSEMNEEQDNKSTPNPPSTINVINQIHYYKISHDYTTDIIPIYKTML